MSPHTRTPRVLTALVALGCLLAAAACGKSPSAAHEPTHRSSSAPPTHAPVDPAKRAAEIVRSMSDTELIGQVLMPVAYGYQADRVSAEAARHNRNIAGADTPAQIVRKYKLGGLMLVNEGDGNDPTAETNPTSNIATPKQVRELTTGLQRAGTADGLPMLISTDQEFGTVVRLADGVSPLPTGLGVGAAHDPKLTERAWEMAGGELSAVGVNMDFAPDADVLGGPGNLVIGSRSFGSDPQQVAVQTAAAVKGLQTAGVAATPKHFPGHGHTTTDSHHAMPVLTQTRGTLDSQDLPPFSAAIGADTWAIMAGHLDVQAVDPGMPATLSHKLLHDVLRTKMKFNGVVVSDALNMQPVTDRYDGGEAAVHALLAGNDLLLEPPNLPAAQKGLLAGLKSGELPRSRLVEAATRVVTLRARLAGHTQPALSTLRSAAHEKVAGDIAAAAVTTLRGQCTGPLVSGTVRLTGGTDQKRSWLTDALRANGITVSTSGGTQVALTGYGDTTRDLSPNADVTVGMDEPYLLSEVRSKTVLATFGATKESMTALAAVLAGKATAPGRSPVPIQGLPRSACG
ncbi:glycoside hydrolase family 3 protein [Actinocatenispora rupis]|uniref:glycoside hydrolase family 3 protein n=1 Tax=Actinocatenispora rupis TaxID=519421 RepID=UPI0019417FB4|nr:glycoside hydrolase family 3 N-terminal domain-containing protein [Actinocatenispora rupis]